jgi:hypothetical protein
MIPTWVLEIKHNPRVCPQCPAEQVVLAVRSDGAADGLLASDGVQELVRSRRGRDHEDGLAAWRHKDVELALGS